MTQLFDFKGSGVNLSDIESDLKEGMAQEAAGRQRDKVEKAKEIVTQVFKDTQTSIDRMKAAISSIRKRERSLKNLMDQHKKLCKQFQEDCNPLPLLEWREKNSVALETLGALIPPEDYDSIKSQLKELQG